MRTFTLVRTVDNSGVSGVGTVAEGVQFHDGQCSLSWFGQHHCVSVWPNVESIDAIHGHNGNTKIVWDDSAGELIWQTFEDAYDKERAK